MEPGVITGDEVLKRRNAGFWIRLVAAVIDFASLWVVPCLESVRTASLQSSKRSRS